MTTDQMQSSAAGGEIVARAGRYYRNTRYIMTALLVAMGGWFLYDGFVKYPEDNRKVQEALERQDPEIKKYTKRTSTDILLQKVLGFSLPPLAAVVLAWALHRSRGEYRLSGEKLSVPGHPTIDLDNIKSVNNDLWDRKGIVWLQYETADGQTGEIVLDDFVYDRPPTDAIYQRIKEKLGITDEGGEEENENAQERMDEEARRD